MNLEIRPRDRRALLGLAVALIVYIGLDWGFLPLWDRLQDAPALASAKEDELRRYRRAVDRQGQYAELEEQVQARLAELESHLVQESNASLASAELQSMVEGAADRFGIAFLQRSMAAPRPADEFVSEIAMTATFRCTVNQLVSLLAEFRQEERLLSVRSLRVAPLEPYEGLQLPEDRDWNKELDVTLTVAVLTPRT